MLQAIFVLIMIIIGKLVYDSYMEQTKKTKKEKKNKKGDVIDISEAWVPLDNLPFRKRETILSAREIGLYNLFSHLLKDSSYIAIPKLSMSEIFMVNPDAEKRQEYQTRLKDKTVELLICELPNFNPVLIVLTDNEAETRKKQITDRFLKSAAQAGSIPLLSMTAEHWEDELMLLQELRSLGIAVKTLH